MGEIAQNDEWLKRYSNRGVVATDSTEWKESYLSNSLEISSCRVCAAIFGIKGI